MTLPAGLFDELRRRAGLSCEYCGVHEDDCGSLLTVDHHRPTSRGGSDAPENLVYCCPRCNQYKADYWPAGPDELPLWNPREESHDAHFRRLDDGRLEAITAVGVWTSDRLRLNRPQLLAHRLRKRRMIELVRQQSALADIERSLIRILELQITELESQRRLLEAQIAILEALLDEPS
jgi:hypothetical protein